MTKVFQILVPDDKLVSRIISCDNQVSELFVIERSDKDFISQSEEDLNNPALYILVNRDLKKLMLVKQKILSSASKIMKLKIFGQKP